MSIEDNRRKEQVQSTLLLKNTSTNKQRKSNTLKTDNKQIIKLIRQKLYPLQAASVKPALIFPKLKEKHLGPTRTSSHELLKKYVEINLEDEKIDVQGRVRTDIEEELIQKYRLNELRKNKEHQNTQYTSYTKLVKPKQFIETRKTQPNEPLSIDHKRHSSYLQNILKSSSDSKHFQAQTQFHNAYLIKIKKELQRQKQNYLKKVNLTQMCEDSKDGQSFNVEYIVKLLQMKRKGGHQNTSKSAYEEFSPNGIADYLTLLSNKKEKNMKLWEQFEKQESLKQKKNEEDMLSISLIRHKIEKNIAIFQDESEFQQSKLLSAKYRLKSNHRKLVQISRDKSKQ